MESCGVHFFPRIVLLFVFILCLHAPLLVFELCVLQAHTTDWVSSPIGAAAPVAVVPEKVNEFELTSASANPLSAHRSPTNLESVEARKQRIRNMSKRRMELGNSSEHDASFQESSAAETRAAEPPNVPAASDDGVGLVRDLEAGDGAQRFRGSINPSKPLGW